jgi:hypothetical protein
MSAGIRRLLDDRGPMGTSLAALLLVAAWVSTWRPQVDPDAWWHVAYGQLILDQGGIPSTERFSWLSDGAPSFLHSWAWDVLMAIADRLGGPTTMSLLGLPFLAGIVILVWLLIGTVARDAAPVTRAALVVVAMLGGLPFWGSRGSTLDVAFVVATVLVVTRYASFGSRRPLLALPLIGLLWANLHGSGVPAFGVCLIAGLGAVPVAGRRGAWTARSIRPLAIASGVAAAATLLNPYGIRLWAYPLDRGVASAFATEIVEWRPPDLGAPELLVFRLLLPLVVLALWRGRAASTHPYVILLAAGWTFVALAVARFVPIAAVLLVVVIAPVLARRAFRAGEDPARGDRRLVILPTVIVAIVLLAIGWSFITPAAQVAAIAHREPVAAVEALRAGACSGRLLAAYEWGGYVIRYGDRDIGAYGNSAAGSVADQTAVELLEVDPGRWLDDHDVDIVMTHATGPLSRWLDAAAGWERRYEDPQASIHARAADDCQI